MGDAVEIREFQERDLDAIVEFSLRAWDPMRASLREVLGDPIFFRLKPDWEAAQAEDVRASCHERRAGTPSSRSWTVGLSGFVTVALNAFNERDRHISGWIPTSSGGGVASQLTRHALDHVRRCGMDIAAVGTGGDPGHAPARAAYEALGFKGPSAYSSSG